MLDIIWFSDFPNKDFLTAQHKELFFEDTFKIIIPDGNIRKIFLKIMFNNLTDEKFIKYRQDVMKDFLDNPQLIEDVFNFLQKIDVFSAEYNNAIKTTKSVLRDTRNSDSLSGATSALQITSFFCKRIIYMILTLKESFLLYDIKSKGLLRVKARLAEFEDKIHQTNIIDIISDLDNMRINETSAHFSLHLDENGRIGEIDLDNVYEPFLSATKHPNRFLKRKGKIKSSECANIRNSEDTNKIISQEILSISDLIYNIAKSIIVEFGSLKESIYFYMGGIQYINYLNEKNVPYCFPDFGANTKVEELYDLNLISRNLIKPEPNNFEFDKCSKGCLISGANGSGKTVYLRSIAVSFFMAQSGLPVPAKRAEYAIVKKIYSLYSHSEFSKEFGMGRFEAEAKEVSDVIFSAESESLIIFNEMFQTTKYREGAEGLYHIFNYLSNKNIRWIAVTHIEDLLSLYKDDTFVKKILIEKYHASDLS